MTISPTGPIPDRDGIPNVLEYAVDLDPKRASVAGLPIVGRTIVSGAGYLTLTYTQVIAAPGITYLPQVSGDLLTWNGGAGYTVAGSRTANSDGVTLTDVVRNAEATGSANKRFRRSQVSRP